MFVNKYYKCLRHRRRKKKTLSLVMNVKSCLGRNIMFVPKTQSSAKSGVGIPQVMVKD